jgi:hypothetical protein
LCQEEIVNPTLNFVVQLFVSEYHLLLESQIWDREASLVAGGIWLMFSFFVVDPSNRTQAPKFCGAEFSAA